MWRTDVAIFTAVDIPSSDTIQDFQKVQILDILYKGKHINHEPLIHIDPRLDNQIKVIIRDSIILFPGKHPPVLGLSLTSRSILTWMITLLSWSCNVFHDIFHYRDTLLYHHEHISTLLIFSSIPDLIQIIHPILIPCLGFIHPPPSAPMS